VNESQEVKGQAGGSTRLFQRGKYWSAGLKADTIGLFSRPLAFAVRASTPLAQGVLSSRDRMRKALEEQMRTPSENERGATPARPASLCPMRPRRRETAGDVHQASTSPRYPANTRRSLQTPNVLLSGENLA
jgi:hypothetical protein